jgi:Protein of unknown function (DUF4058)
MSSPFPGMDPYVEDPEVWSDFHGGLVLAKSAVGKRFINLYCQIAPHTVPYIRSHHSVKFLLRYLLGVMVLIATRCIHRRQDRA